MSELIRYAPPFYLLHTHLTRGILTHTRGNVAAIYRGFVERMQPAPTYFGLEHLPESPRFVLAANHYQRKGLWIAHAASVLATATLTRYGCNPPIRWIVTGNWPRWKFGPFAMRSPGDILLPRVAHATWCYAVPFAGTNPSITARSLRRVLKDAATLECPVGIFPEGAKAVAGKLGPALDGVGRFLWLIADRGWPVLPAGISENGAFVVRFGAVISADSIHRSTDPGQLVMSRIAALTNASAPP